MNKIIQSMFLDYFNNYSSIGLFAEHNGISADLAALIVKEGRILHELNIGGINSLTTEQKNYYINKLEY